MARRSQLLAGALLACAGAFTWLGSRDSERQESSPGLHPVADRGVLELRPASTRPTLIRDSQDAAGPSVRADGDGRAAQTAPALERARAAREQPRNPRFRTVRARVVDQGGVPQPHVPLAKPSEGGYFRILGLTDERGECSFEFLRQRPSLAVALPLDPPVEGNLDEHGFVELVVPQLGELEFRLPGGKHTAGALELDFPESAVLEDPVQVQVTVQDFPLRLAIPLGTEYSFGFRSSEHRPLIPEMQAPLSRILASRVHVVELGDRLQVLEGRLLLPGGEPCRNPRALFEGPDRPGPGSPLRRSFLGEEGRFRFVYPVSAGDGEAVRFLGGSNPTPLDLECLVPLPARFSGIDHDFGDIQLAPRPVLLSGRFVLSTSGAADVPRPPAVPSSRRDASLRRDARLHVYRREPGVLDWAELGRSAHIDRESLTFRIFGEPAGPGDYRVHLESAGAAQLSCGLFSPGSRSFVIEVGPPAKLATKLTLDGEDSTRSLALRLDYEECSAAPPDLALRAFRTELDGLHPGRASVTLQHAGSVLWSSGPLDLVSGQRAELAIDLSGELLDIHVTPEWSGPTPAHRSRVFYRESDEGPYDLEAQKSRGFRILSRAPSVDLVIRADGYAAQRYDDVTRSFAPAMPLGPTLHIADPKGYGHYNDLGSLSVRLIPEDERLRSTGPIGLHLGKTGSVPAPGSYRVEWGVWLGQWNELDIEGPRIEVVEGHQTLELALPIVALEAFRAHQRR